MERDDINKAGFRQNALDSALSYAMRVNVDNKIISHEEVLIMAKDFSDFLFSGEITKKK